MASDNEASCESDPNFAVICAFMEKFGATCGLASIDFLELQEMLENTQEVPQELIDLHIKLLRKSRKTVSNERWEKAVIKFCHSFCVQDAWEIERFGYKKARLSSKLRVLKELLEMQFDYNARFKAEINKMSAEELRSQPLGKDKHGHAYWIQNDNNCQIRVYKEDPDEETWTLVAKDRDGLVALITELSNGDADSKAIAEAALNEEDSNSLVEKPIIDTGQVDSSSSDSNKKSVDESDNSNESRKAEEEEEEESVEEEEAEEEEKKRPLDEMEEEAAAKRPKMEEVVGEAVEEPMMLVKGEGEGVENECENPIVGEEIEEDLMYFYGNGNGVDCETGNEDETKKNEQQQNASAVSDVSGESSENCVSISSDVVDAPARSEVPTSHVKIPFKLGTIIDTKTDNKIFNSARSPTKKASRWDVETIMAKEPSPEVAPPPKKAMFFFGPGCMQFKPSPSPSATVAFGQKVPQTEGVEEPAANVDEESTTVEEAEVRSVVEEEKSDVGYRIEATKNSVETSECVQSIGEAVGQTNDDEVSDEKVEGTLLVDQQTPLLESRIEDKLVEVSSDKIEETKASQVVHVDQELESSQEIPKTEDKEETLETRKCEETPVKDEEQDVVSTEVTLELKKSEETPVKDQEQDVVSTEVTLELKKSEETPVKDEEQEVVSTEVTLELKKGEETPVKDEEQDVVLTEVTLEPNKSEEAPVKDEEQDVVSTEVTLEPKKSEEIPVEPVKGQEQGAVMTEVEKSTEYEEIPTQPVNVQEQEVISAEVRKSTECEEFEEKSAPESLKNEENEGKMEEPGVELTQNIENEGKEQTNEEELTKETEGAENVSVPEPKESTQSEEKNEETDMENLKSEDKQELGVTLREEHPTNEEQPECIEKDADLTMEVTRPNENEEKKEESEVKLTESDENTEEKEKDSTIELPKSIPSEEKEESVAQITQPEEKDDDEIEQKLIETEAKPEEVTTKDENERIPIEVSSEKTENDVSSQKNDDEVSLEKTEDVEMGEIEEKQPKVEKETEVAPALSEIEKQIVSEENKFCDLNTEQNIPEVTAALVQYEEKLEERVEEFKETDLITNNSCVVEHQKQEETEEKQPVAEEECVKKHSYILGEETEKEKLEEHVEDEKPNDKPESADSETVESLASENLEENEDTQKVSEEPITEPQTSTTLPPLTSREEDISKVLDVVEEKPVITEKKETTATVEDDKLPIEEKPNCSMAAKQEPISDEIKETVICSSVKNELDVKQKEPSPPPRLVEENVADAVKENVVDTVKTKKEPTNNNNKGVRGRRNNVSTDQPKIFTRRTTRSSRSDETRLVEEKPSDLEVSTVKEEKKPETTSPKTEEQPTTVVQPRRGRSRGMAKAEKEETPEVDTSKKIKLSEEAREETETKPTTRRNKMMKENAIQEEKMEEMAVEEAKPEQPLPEVVTVESGNSNDVMDGPEKDPLAVSEEETTVKLSEEKKPMSLATFSLDFHESPAPPVTRSGLRKRGRESPPNCEEIEETAGKRLKKGKRNVDVKLRKSIEEQKKQELISSDDDKQQQNEEAKNLKKRAGKNKKVDQAKNEESVVVSSDAEAETPTKEAEPAQKKTKTVNKNKRLLSNLGINPDQPLKFEEGATIGVRQSRRIAQLKIKEEAERRKLEEEMALEQQHTQKKKKSKKSEDKEFKIKKSKNEVDDEDEAQEEDSVDSKKRKKKKKKKHKKLFDEYNPWRSSSDSSTTDDEEEDEEIVEEEDDEVLQYVSDHEFSPESDLEADGEAQPLKRARTARKESDVEEVDDCPCQKCGKSDHPEWILLCDRCDNGWHCSCLRPPLLVIPEGDWFCPPCQHSTLLKKLQEKLKDYDKKLSKKEIEDRRKQRLAYVGISLNSVLPAKETETVKKRRLSNKEDDDDDAEDDEVEDEEQMDEEEEEESEESGSGTGSETGSDSDEPIYQLRQRRQAHSYRFNDYDELINSAIQEEMEAVKGAGNQGRGKDIATIVNAEKEEEERKKETENGGGEIVAEEADEAPEPLPPVVPPDDRDKEAKPLYSDDEQPVRGKKKKIIGRKKHRKLNSLDISSADDDEDSDEDFKGTSTESDDDFDEDLGSEDSEDLDSGRNRRRNTDPVRRSTRARTSRYDADFIDDGDSEDEDEAPRRKKKRSIWDDSESEESDRSWGRRKRKPPANRKKNSNASTASSKKKKSKKKKKKNDDSDAEVYRKKKPKIKFGLEGEDEGPGRRTRGKKINYVDALGSDSDEDRVKRPPPRIESEEEYVANEEDELDEDDKVTDEEESTEENSVAAKSTPAAAPPPKIQSYADARFTQLLPEGVPTPKDLYANNQVIRDEDGEDEPNPIDQINRNVEMMDENEMEKMMEEEEYANKQLQMVAMQLEKEKRRKEREAKKLEGLLTQPQQDQKKRVKAPPPTPVPVVKSQFQFMQEPIVGNVDSLIVNSENNDELSEPPGVSLPLFAELGAENLEDPAKKRRGRSKKSLEEAVAVLGSARQQEAGFMSMAANNNKNLPTDLSSSTTTQDSNIEIAAPPQPFSQSQPTPSVITRMLQSKPGQPGYPVGTIRPKQFATMPERDEDQVLTPTSAPPPPATHHSMSPAPAHHGQYMQGMRSQLASPYRQLPPPAMNHYPRVGGAIRNPPPQSLPSHLYHRSLDPSPSGGGAINIADHHNSPGRVVSPASSSPGGVNKNETPPPPPYSRPPPVGRFPMINTTAAAGPRHIPMVAPPPPQHLQPRSNLSPYHPGMPYHYGQFGGQGLGGSEEALPPTVYQNSPYSEQFGGGGGGEGAVNPSENSNNSKSFDEESGGEFGGLVSYFSSQREDDLES